MEKHNNETKLKIKNILMFIVNNFDEFERMNSFNKDKIHDDLVFNNKKEFIEHNKKCVIKMNKDDIDFLNILCEKIQNREILTTDMEYCTEWVANVIYFNKYEELVIAHPR